MKIEAVLVENQYRADYEDLQNKKQIAGYFKTAEEAFSAARDAWRECRMANVQNYRVNR